MVKKAAAPAKVEKKPAKTPKKSSGGQVKSDFVHVMVMGPTGKTKMVKVPRSV